MQRLRTIFRRKVTPPQWVVIGLGNPGARYRDTRHNIGYAVADDFLSRHQPDQSWSRAPRRVPAKTVSVELGGIPVLVARSTTFMNLSGKAAVALARLTGVPAQRIIVIHDELDLPAGTVRIKAGGHDNGHNGLKSIAAELGTRDIIRIRMGIGRPPAGQQVAEYVLQPWDSDHNGAAIDGAIGLGSQAVELIITDGIAKAQQRIHSAT